MARLRNWMRGSDGCCNGIARCRSMHLNRKLWKGFTMITWKESSKVAWEVGNRIAYYIIEPLQQRFWQSWTRTEIIGSSTYCNWGQGASVNMSMPVQGWWSINEDFKFQVQSHHKTSPNGCISSNDAREESSARSQSGRDWYETRKLYRDKTAIQKLVSISVSHHVQQQH
jgi:hypothetical protein